MNNTKLDKYIPSTKLRIFVQCLLSEEVKGNKIEAERRTGVRRQLFYWYFEKSSEFRKWFSDQCDKFLGLNQAIPSHMLMKKILEGDVQAIRTYYELLGKLKLGVKMGVKVGVNMGDNNNGRFVGEDRELQERIRAELLRSIS